MSNLDKKIFRALREGNMTLEREVTTWDVDYRPPNHDYILDKKGHMVAYRRYGEGEWMVHPKPSKVFSKRYRQFKRLPWEMAVCG